MTARRVVFAALSVALLSVAAVGAAWAQDPVKVAPNIYTLLFENERVRVCDIKFEAGEKIVSHSHPDHFLYVMSAGTLKISHPDGTSAEFAGTPGQVAWIPAETHWAENVGKTEFHAIVVELKETPSATPKAEAPAEKK